MSNCKIQTNLIQLTLHSEEKHLMVTVTDSSTGRNWGPVSLLKLEVHDKPLKRVADVYSYSVPVLNPIADDAVDLVITDTEHGIELGLKLRLLEKDLSVQIIPSKILERDKEMYRLFAIDIMPGLMAVTGNGRLLLPINMGLESAVAKAPRCSDKFLIYGEQERWELTPSLPICAAYDEQGGMICLATKGASDTECRVETDGKGKGLLGFAITFRRHWPDPVDQGNRELRFSPIPPKTDPLAFCARHLRRHVMEDLGKKTLMERAAESPEVAYLLDAYIMKLFHGIQNVGYMMAGQKEIPAGAFQSYLTFDEARNWLGKIHAAGIGKVLTQCTGWNIGGHDGLYPTRFPVEERLGGENKFREMIRFGNELGFNMQVHDNFVMMCKNSPHFVRDYATIDIYGEPLVHGRWAGGVECSGWPLSYPDELLSGHMRKMQALGLKGMFYVDYMGQPLEVNYHPKHGGPRSDCARGQKLIIEEGRRIFGSCGTEFGFLPVAIPADHISTCGDPWHLTMCHHEWPVSGLIKTAEVVPLWQMVMSGLVVVEARGHVAWRNAMESVLYGRAPRDEWGQRLLF